MAFQYNQPFYFFMSTITPIYTISNFCLRFISIYGILLKIVLIFGGNFMHYNESAENYLETILVLSKQLPVVRAVDIANELGFKKSSVSIAMKHLREKEHIVVSDAGFITLTESGRTIAEMIFERHEILTSALMSLGVPEDIASEDACRLEHVISTESFEALKSHFATHKKK